MSIFEILLIIGLVYPIALLLSGAIPVLVRTLKAWDRNFKDIIMGLWVVSIGGGLVGIAAVNFYIMNTNLNPDGSLAPNIPESTWALQHWVMLAVLYLFNFTLTVTYYGFHTKRLNW